ncbi:DUF563 domain-containing protein [Diaporthe eres]|nr:DUF563 domain-containing protein [Diaporthe eres]
MDRGLFCITRGVVLDEEDKRFSFGCDTSPSSKKSPRSLFNSDEMQRKSGILRMSSDIRQGDSFVTITADLPRTQFIFLDELPEGPLYDLRSFFAGLTPTRFKDIFEDKTRAEALSSAHTAIMPLPGSSNPLSQIDQWKLHNYGVLYPPGGIGASKFVKVTLIACTGRRKIRDADHLLRALHLAFPNVIVWFMGDDECVIVEIQPAGLAATHHRARYKNLATMLRRTFFMAKLRSSVPLGQGGGLIMYMEQGHGGDKAVHIKLAMRDMELAISEDVFVAQIGRAIQASVVQGHV